MGNVFSLGYSLADDRVHRVRRMGRVGETVGSEFGVGRVSRFLSVRDPGRFGVDCC